MTVRSSALSAPAQQNNSEIYIGLTLMWIIGVMFIPIPAFLLDLFLATSFTISLLILLVSLYTVHILEFSVFPTLLLVTTLFRLGLNVASTKLILLHGNEGVEAAGGIIKTFGQFVIGGNYVVGAVIFFIFVIINFMVITKGAGRVAEVAARFALDSIPGKQMAIDSDLSNNVITDQEARKRRKDLAREADFHGAMDGASKYVRGDAIASIMIVLVNIVGGFVIGVVQKGMPMGQALANYTLLTIGEGLVSQVPALLISIAAGIIVSRSADDNNLGQELAGQFLKFPKAFLVSSGVLFVLALVPNMPHLAFLALSGASYMLSKKAAERGVEVKEDPEVRDEDVERVTSIRPLYMLGLEVGAGLVPLVDSSHKGEFSDRIYSIRKQVAERLGFIVPPIDIYDNLQLKPHEYNVLINGARVGGGELLAKYLVMSSRGTAVPLEGQKTTEPVFGMPAIWIKEHTKEQALDAGYTVVDNTTILATHISEIIKKHAHELIGRQELQHLLDGLAATQPKVVEELIPGLLPLGTLLRVIKNLLRESVSIRDLRSILETLADYAVVTKDADMLTEFVRQNIGRSIIEQYKDADNDLYVISLDKAVEELIADSVDVTEQGLELALEPGLAQKLIHGIRSEAGKFEGMKVLPVLMTTTTNRRHIRKLTERYMSNLAVISHGEIPSNIKIKSLGVVANVV